MKSIHNMLAGLCCLVLASCVITPSNISFNGKKIKPSKNTTTRTYTLNAFDAVTMNAIGQVKIVQTGQEEYKLVLKAPENFIPLYAVSVKNENLAIDFTRRNINLEGRHVDITIYAPTLHKLENSGVGTLSTDSLNSEELAVENSGVGNIVLKGLRAKRMDVECSGVGSIELSGTAQRANMRCSGVGSINAFNLQTADTEADVSGVGSINCFASERIKGEVSGVGSLKYGGRPKEKDLHRSGVGGIGER